MSHAFLKTVITSAGLILIVFDQAFVMFLECHADLYESQALSSGKWRLNAAEFRILAKEKSIDPPTHFPINQPNHHRLQDITFSRSLTMKSIYQDILDGNLKIAMQLIFQIENFASFLIEYDNDYSKS